MTTHPTTYDALLDALADVVADAREIDLVLLENTHAMSLTHGFYSAANRLYTADLLSLAEFIDITNALGEMISMGPILSITREAA